METPRTRGREKIAELGEKLTVIPRSVVIKTDILREGIKMTETLEQVGPLSFAHFLVWNSSHAWNPKVTEEGKKIFAVPWKFILEGDHTPVVCRPDAASPYEIRLHEGRFVLFRDGEEIEPVRFERGARWIWENTRDGTSMGSVLLSWTREALLGCALRHCAYTKSGDQCVYCCLDAEIQQWRNLGLSVEMAITPENAAEAYRAAVEEVGSIRHVAFTGGSLLDTNKEMEKYVSLYSALRDVRDELGADTQFYACVTAPPDREILRRLHEAGLNHIAPNMDCWEEKLWPVIVPGKHKFVGRKFWIDSLLACLEVYGEGMVGSAFVVGPEMVQPHGFRSLEEGIESWAGCFSWCTSHHIIPMLIPWQKEVGSPWQHESPPPTEYTLGVFAERHRQMVESGMYGIMDHKYFMGEAWDTNADFRRLTTGCRCTNCTPPDYPPEFYVQPEDIAAEGPSAEQPA